MMGVALAAAVTSHALRCTWFLFLLLSTGGRVRRRALPLVRALRSKEHGGGLLDDKQRVFWMAVRQALIIFLRALDTYLDREQTIPTRTR